MPRPQPSPQRIVAVGLLTQRDVEVLGTGFKRLYPVERTHAFDDLLAELDRLDWPEAERAAPR